MSEKNAHDPFLDKIIFDKAKTWSAHSSCIYINRALIIFFFSIYHITNDDNFPKKKWHDSLTNNEYQGSFQEIEIKK